MMNVGLVVLILAWEAVAFGAYACARLTKPDRNYWPMIRVIWTALAVFAQLAAVGAIMGRVNTIGGRLVFAGILLAAILYSIYFMRRRNHIARYLPLDLGGQVIFVDEEHLRHQSENITSFVQHGTAPEEWVKGLEEACAEWRRMDRWKHDTAAQMRDRRAKRGA